LDVLNARESLQSTGVGSGVAIPHGRVGCLDRFVGALAIHPHGVEFASIDGMRVRNVPDLAVALGRSGVGNRATLEVRRDGQTLRLAVDVIDLNPPGPMVPRPAARQP
jgi:hypothetical protein